MALKEIRSDFSSVIKKTLEDLNTIVAPETRNNLSPVFQRPMDQHYGIEITGQFKTNDSSSEGKMSYITVKRNRDIAVPFDGYGVAWKKGDGTKYNVYIVDNDALTSDVFINEKQMWDQSGGINQFLAAATLEILIDVWYEFNIKIYAKNGMDVWIYRVDSPPAELNAANRVIYRGQTYPPYMTQSSGDHFGVAVLDTINSEWWYRSLSVNSIIQTFPMQLFKIKAATDVFESGNAFTLKYYGIGYGESENSTKFYAKKVTTDEWTLCGSHTHGVGSTLSQLELVKSLTDIDDYRDDNQYINVLATPYNINDENHYLRSYYVSAANTLLSGIHRGNMTDIYVEAKERISVTTQSIVLTNSEINLRTNGNFIMPIVDIVGISRTASGVAFVENEDYTVTRLIEGNAYSIRDDVKIIFDDPDMAGISVNIQYRYYEDGEAIQTLLESDTYRYPGSDNLLKINPLSIIKIERFDYRGDVEIEEIQTALITFINAIDDGIFEISDLINAAYGAGAVYVDLITLDINIKDQEYLGTYFNDSITNSYELTGTLKTYFCDVTSTYGVNKLE